MKNVMKLYTQSAFLLCVGILAAAGVSKKAVIEWYGVQQTKEAIPLKKSLSLMDVDSLAPYKVIRKDVIDNQDILKQLGTEEYLQWILEDTDADQFSSMRYCSLFITYYTGNPDQVPHIPDECYVGGGSQRLGRKMIELNIKGISNSSTKRQEPAGSNSERKIRVKYVVFVKKSSDMWEATSKFPVLYFFKTNGVYSGGREGTREILARNFFGRYSYFSKVECKFFGGGRGGNIYPNEEQMIESSEKLLSVILPILERDHWPDWEKADSSK